MLSYSMTVSLDGYVNDRDGGIDWSAPSDEVFDAHLTQVGELGAHLLGRRLYETMRVWETDPALRATGAGAQFADVWTALPKVVFSRTLSRVEGNARLATANLADEIAAALASTNDEVAIGGAELAAAAFEADLIDELRIFRAPVVLGGGTPYLPAVAGQRRFELIETRTFDTGLSFARYRRTRA